MPSRGAARRRARPRAVGDQVHFGTLPRSVSNSWWRLRGRKARRLHPHHHLARDGRPHL